MRGPKTNVRHNRSLSLSRLAHMSSPQRPILRALPIAAQTVQEFTRTEQVQLGHARLAIIDLTDGGRQPMASSDGRHVVTEQRRNLQLP